MEAAFKIPSDLQLLTQFKELASALGRSKAYHVFYLVWQELFLRAQEGAPKGRLPASQVPGLIRTLLEVEPDPAKCDEMFHKAIVEQSRLLERDGEDLVCPRFMVLNAQTGKGSAASIGGSRKSFMTKQKRLQADAFQQSLLIRPEVFIDGDGKKLDSDQVKRVMRLVISCDNALYKPERMATGYSEGLIQAALSVLAKFTDEEINLMVTKVSMNRDHPALNGMVAERLLPELEATVRKLG